MGDDLTVSSTLQPRLWQQACHSWFRLVVWTSLQNLNAFVQAISKKNIMKKECSIVFILIELPKRNLITTVYPQTIQTYLSARTGRQRSEIVAPTWTVGKSFRTFELHDSFHPVR